MKFKLKFSNPSLDRVMDCQDQEAAYAFALVIASSNGAEVVDVSSISNIRSRYLELLNDPNKTEEFFEVGLEYLTELNPKMAESAKQELGLNGNEE